MACLWFFCKVLVVRLIFGLRTGIFFHHSLPRFPILPVWNAILLPGFTCRNGEVPAIPAGEDAGDRFIVVAVECRALGEGQLVRTVGVAGGGVGDDFAIIGFN